ncbi:MAG: LacI family transcriptional regulator [Anaerolineae bacterium]|nr:LacI family transcriptional regulator [Anaerolineae bacterium]
MSTRGNPINNKPTIKDVARLCGVSTQTISRVLNKRPDVSPETRERVLEVINQLGYQPSALARSLIQQRSYTLGIIIAGLKYAGISLTLNGIAEQADQEGYSLLIKELPSFDVSDVQPVIRSLMAHQVEAIIYAAPECGNNWRNVQSQCPRPCPPMVFLKGNPYSDFSTISIDNFMGAYLATRHLLDQGCHHIAHISGPMDWWEAIEREKGWHAALEDAKLPPEDRQCALGNWSSSSGERAFYSLLESYPEVDGVFAGNDQMALSVLYVAAKKKIKIPEQLAVVGFDDLSESPYYSPSLTTIRQDLRMLGTMAVKKAIEMVNEPVVTGDSLSDTIVIKPQLIVRESSLFGRTL